jgi:hypothetical protein
MKLVYSLNGAYGFVVCLKQGRDERQVGPGNGFRRELTLPLDKHKIETIQKAPPKGLPRTATSSFTETGSRLGYLHDTGDGALENDAGVTTKKLSIVGSNSSASFGGNLVYGLTGIPGSPWALQCSGGTRGNFQNSGTSLTKVSCAGLPVSAPKGGRAAGK